ncbi:heterodisulfide reductase-related iron-sulfur binding cluster [Candidatus Acidulodesulfobacterium sp. H_13]|uniref:heterodisulfide reductase-related iron-sulfur binding cluster n=1 Tax=Candidatus Acidulodesulfobacterium sp. H_13 TaxID=3395470 RepID=UPI003AF53F1A
MYKTDADPKITQNFNIRDTDFLDEKNLFNEIKRVYSKCKSCRLCIGFCPSFPALFNAVDDKSDDIEALTQEELIKPLDLCFYCKQCYFKCPFTPPHEWKVDFPHLALRYKIFRFKKEGAGIRDKLLVDTDKMGKSSIPVASIVNKLNNMKLFRYILEPVMGIDKRAKVPSFNKISFEKWFHGNYKIDDTVSDVNKFNGKVVLFYTCMLNYNFLDRGIALIKVLEKNNVYVELPDIQCCGIPYYDTGDIDNSIKKAKYNIKNLKKYVEDGFDIIVPVPTCAMQIKHEYPLLLPDSDDAVAIANKTFDIHEYLYRLYQNGKFNTDFKKSMGKIGYHISCHLKSLNVGYKALNLLRLIPETSVQIIEKCSGHDGTFGVKKKTFEYALGVGKSLFEDIDSMKMDYYISDCPLASDQIEMGTGKKVLHPIEILFEAYSG